jgi:lipoate-protein ligase A
MSTDQWLAREMGLSLDRPILRFYGWYPFCVSLGYHQNSDEINLNQCDINKFEVVRRPTGGRAIFHAEELTYSVIYPSNSISGPDIYRLIHNPIVSALNDLNIDARFNQTQPDLKGFYASEKSSVCFATAAQYEVEIDRKKLIGSAQRIYEQGILQHGSILLGQTHQKLIDLLNINIKQKENLKKHTQTNTAVVWQTSKNISAELLSEKITDCFSKEYGINFSRYEPPLSSNNSYQISLDNSLKILSFDEPYSD